MEDIASQNGSVVEMSREELVALLEEGAGRRRKMTAYEMLHAYRSGNLEDPGDVADLLIFANLLPDDDPLFADLT